MIIEKAEFTVPEGREADFEAAMLQAKEIIGAARGFRSLRVNRGLERTSTYLLLIEWDTLADHLEGFRESEAFPAWRALVGPFFAQAPQVEQGHQTGS